MKDFERIDRLEKDFDLLLSAINEAYLEMYNEGKNQKSIFSKVSHTVTSLALQEILVKFHKVRR